MQGGILAPLVRAVRLILGGLVFVGLALNVLNVLLRYIFLSPLTWAEELLSYGMVWCVFLGAFLVTLDRRHLSMNILYMYLPASVQRFVDLLVLAAMIAVCGFVVVQSWNVVSLMFQYDQRSMAANFPMGVAHASVLVGFMLMLIAAIFAFGKQAKAGPPGDMTPSDAKDR